MGRKKKRLRLLERIRLANLVKTTADKPAVKVEEVVEAAPPIEPKPAAIEPEVVKTHKKPKKVATKKVAPKKSSKRTSKRK